jgi:antitoxin component YwqK of YwqJK toxin-antitoxin module
VLPPVPGEINASTELKRILIIDDDPHPNITAHFNPSQYPGGMTCVYAIVADADGDAIDAEFVLLTPLFGRGNMYTAIPIPNATNATNPITSKIKLSDGKTLAESFPDGYPIGAILDNYKVMEAYNAVLTADIERDITIVFTTPVLGEFPYVIGFNQSGIRNGYIYPEDIVTEAPNPLGLVPKGTVFKVIVVEGSWEQGTAKGYLWMIPVTDDFWDPRHAHPHQVPTLFVNGVQKATCSYVGQTLPVIWEAPCDPNIEQTTHDRRHVFDPGTIVSGGGTVNIEARVGDMFSPQERAFGMVAWPTPTSMEEEDTSDGEFNCPIPNEASHIVGDYSEYWWTPNGSVGPHYSWYDREKTKKYRFKCYNIEGELHGVSKEWYEDGTLYTKKNYKDGKKHGVYKVWYEDGTLRYEGNYKDGKLHGVYKQWHEDGTLRYEWNYKDDKLHGVYKQWYEDGTLYIEKNYKDYKLHGVYKQWYEDGTLYIEKNYKDGKLHGVSKEWYEDGTLRYEWNYKDGIYKEWYEDGTLKEERHYKDDKTRVVKKWREDGTLYIEKNYKDDKLHGVYKQWYEDGTLYSERNYKDGKKHGVYKEWHEDGTLRYEGNYKDGEKHGVCKFWSANGKLIEECNYEEGNCVSCVHGHC